MRGVIVGSILAVTGAIAGCRGANTPSGAATAVEEPVDAPTRSAAVAPPNPPVEAGSPAPFPPGPSTHEEGDALFVKPLGSLRTPRIAATKDGVVLAAAGGCQDPRGPFGPGARAPGSFVVLAKLDGGGNKVWQRTFVTPCADPPAHAPSHAIAGLGLDPDGNIYVAGDLREPIDFGGGTLASAGGSDVFVASFDAAGQHRWSKRFGDAADQRIHALAVSQEGLVAVTGALEGSAEFGGGVVRSAGKGDAFVAVLDPAGQHVASHAFGDPGEQAGDLIAFGAKGELTLAGRYEGAIDFGGGPLAGGKTGGRFVAQYRDSGPSFTPRFAYAFSKALPGELTVGALAGGGDETYLAGAFKGAVELGGGPLKAHEPEDRSEPRSDAFVLRLDGAGKHVFSRAFGLGGAHRIEALVAAGDVWLAGAFSGMTRFNGTMVSAGGDDALLVHLDGEKGEVRRAWRFGDTFAQEIVGLASSGASSSLLLLAHAAGTIDFGTGPRSEHGLFLVKLAPGAGPAGKDGGPPGASPSAKDGGAPAIEAGAR